MKICAIDPGTKETGLALFDDGKLKHCTLMRAKSIDGMINELANVDWPALFDYPDIVIVEQPTIYPRDGAKKSNALIKVSLIAGAAASAFGCSSWTTVKFVEPRTWKGSVPKDIHNKRTLDKLDHGESLVYTMRMISLPGGLVHNMVDAIGLGLYEIGR